MSKLPSSMFCFVVMWKLPQMPSYSANKVNLDKNNFDMFYNIDCCAAIHGRIWMNNVPNERRIIMLSCTVISFVIFFPNFFNRNLESNLGFILFFFRTVESVIDCILPWGVCRERWWWKRMNELHQKKKSVHNQRKSWKTHSMSCIPNLYFFLSIL